jgi:hypothetical protein
MGYNCTRPRVSQSPPQEHKFLTISGLPDPNMNLLSSTFKCDAWSLRMAQLKVFYERNWRDKLKRSSGNPLLQRRRLSSEEWEEGRKKEEEGRWRARSNSSKLPPRLLLCAKEMNCCENRANQWPLIRAIYKPRGQEMSKF